MHLLPITGQEQIPNYLRRGHLSVDHHCLPRRPVWIQAIHKTHFFTYLPLSESLPLDSEVISKAPKSAFYGDPCLSGQFRGALVISLQPARNAPQQRRTRGLNRADAVWANSAGSRQTGGLFDISGEGFVEEIDAGRAQWSGMWCRGYGRVDLSRSCNLKSPQVLPL